MSISQSSPASVTVNYSAPYLDDILYNPWRASGWPVETKAGIRVRLISD
jgi:hypothetical protein